MASEAPYAMSGPSPYYFLSGEFKPPHLANLTPVDRPLPPSHLSLMWRKRSYNSIMPLLLTPSGLKSDQALRDGTYNALHYDNWVQIKLCYKAFEDID